MVILSSAIKIAQKVYKYRHLIYRTLAAQDKAISGSLSKARWSKASSYGWRTGAAAGGLVGPLINMDADDTPGNGIQKGYEKFNPPSKPYKTRRGRTIGYNRRYEGRQYPDKYSRCPSYRKRKRS